jgi:ATP-dependent protease Clp ATPase subunit
MVAAMIKGVRYCSFCAQSEIDATCLIAGPTVHICDDCVALSVSIVIEKYKRCTARLEEKRRKLRQLATTLSTDGDSK